MLILHQKRKKKESLCAHGNMCSHMGSPLAARVCEYKGCIHVIALFPTEMVEADLFQLPNSHTQKISPHTSFLQCFKLLSEMRGIFCFGLVACFCHTVYYISLFFWSSSPPAFSSELLLLIITSYEQIMVESNDAAS